MSKTRQTQDEYAKYYAKLQKALEPVREMTREQAIRTAPPGVLENASEQDLWELGTQALLISVVSQDTGKTDADGRGVVTSVSIKTLMNMAGVAGALTAVMPEYAKVAFVAEFLASADSAGKYRSSFTPNLGATANNGDT